MTQINCYLPIKVRIVGELSDAELAQLGQTLVRTVRARLALAEQTLATRHNLYNAAGDVEVREAYDAAREDAESGSYRVPSYDRQGQPVSMRLQEQRGGQPKRLWFVRVSISFRIQVKKFIEWIGSLDNDSATFVADNQARYFDLLETVRSATVWLVVVNRPMLIPPLATLVQDRYEKFVPSNLDYIYGYTPFEAARQRLLAAEEGNRLQEVPDFSRNPGGYTRDRDAFLNPKGMLLFAAMTLPKVDLTQLAALGQEITVSLFVRDLAFIVNPDSFGRLFGVTWANYLAEFGNQMTSLHIQTVTPLQRVHYNTLKALVDARIAEQIAEDAAYFGNLYLLNQKTLEWTPTAVQTRLANVTDDATRALDEQRRFGHWEAGWAGAFIYAVISLTADERATVRHRPVARKLTPRLIALLQGDPTDYTWPRELMQFLNENFERDPPDTRPPDGTVFEFVLAELENRRLFNTLFEKVEAADNTGLHQRIVRLALATRYASNERVQKSQGILGSRVLGRRENIYHTQPPAIFLDREAAGRVRVNEALGDVNSIYIFEHDDKRLRPARVPAFREALQAEREALIGRILSGQDTKQYTEEDFTRTVIAAAAQRIHLSEKDFEEITIQRSIRLLGVEARIEKALPRYYITFEFVERVKGEAWQSVSKSLTEIEDDFEARLIYWQLGRAGEVYEKIGIAISVIGLVAIAWEVGLIAALVEAAGGATTLLISISISELIYVIRVVFGDAKLSLRGFLEAALDGYLMALGFRGAGILGRAAAKAIGTQSLKSLIGGWVAERLIVGVVGGAGTAALTTFSHDLINIATGSGGWSSIGEYVHKMTWGALLGTVFEFGVGALQPLLRAGGESALQSLSDVVKQIRAEGFTAVRWTALTTEALGNFRAKMTFIIGDVAANGFARAMGERLAQVVEQLGNEYRLAVFRRLLELSPVGLSRPAVDGLEKLLNASRADLTNEAALALLNRLTPDQLRSFLEAANLLDSAVTRALARGGQLDTLANAPQLAGTIQYDPVLRTLIANTADLPAAQAATRLRGLLGVAGDLPIVPETLQRGAFFARGGTSQLYEVTGRADLLAKAGGGRLPVEAKSLVELELLGIDTVYAGTRTIDGQTHIILQRVDGVGSKDIIGRLRQPLRTPAFTEVVTQRTIDDLERIYQRLGETNTNVGDFQFIVRRSDGAVFVNDPVSVTRGAGPSGNIRSIIDRFRRILRDRQTGGTP